MSGRIEISAEFSGQGDFSDALDRALRLKVRKSSDPCPECVKNEDPERIPMHSGCQCDVVWADD